MWLGTPNGGTKFMKTWYSDQLVLISTNYGLSEINNRINPPVAPEFEMLGVRKIQTCYIMENKTYFLFHACFATLLVGPAYHHVQ